MPPKQDKSVPDFIPDVRTGATAGQSGKYYASGISTPPNGGQVTDVDNPEPNDAPDFIPDNPPPAPKPPERFSTELLKEIPYAAGQAGLGALKGAGSTLDAIGHVVYPDWLEKRLTGKVAPDHAFDATNPFQSAGKGVEKAAEFLIPGLGEEDAVNAATKLLPIGEKVVKPLSRFGYNAVTSGLINKAQGGGFVNGAAAGGMGSVVSDAAHAFAPHLIEFGQSIHTPGAKTGRAILDETSGIFPGGIRRSAREAVNNINSEMEGAVKAASVRPNPVRALLPPPTEEIPLANVPEDMIDVPGQFVRAARMPGKNIVGGLPDPRNIEQLGMDRATLPPARLVRSAYTTGTNDEINDLNRSGPGVLLRTVGGNEAPPEIPATIPNASVSLRPVRGVAQSNIEKAFGENEPKMHSGAKRLARIVTSDLNGEPIPENVTPWKALELRRGVDKALPPGSFNPESTNAFKGYRTPLRNALNEGIGNVVPEYRPLATRESNLIPATKPAKRGFGHLWGPGAGAIFGGYYGARAGARNDGGFTGAVQGGLTGAAEGAAAGTILPAFINSSARVFNSPVLHRVVVPLAEGSGLQMARKPSS